MWRSVGLFRTREGLQDAVSALDAAHDVDRERMRAATPDADRWRRSNLVAVARLIARAALRREESRGAHFRADFPAHDDVRWRVHMADVRGDPVE
jgi:L-aspartate oxidase